ncbi:MAG: nickel pincer cofactor biosynthesis protein LarC [Actinomycetes bacterium]|nr:nickel pincer cofactor biosynthesis protein LarC [Actinomycetes bacterium]
MTGVASRIAHLDCSTGVSGDKFLGAVLDAGQRLGVFDLERLQALADELVPGVTVSASAVVTGGVSALQIRVDDMRDDASAATTRSWADIRSLLSGRDRALQVFAQLAAAEAAVHGVRVDDVHFHEVGAADSIVDIVGVCAGLDALGITRLYATPPALGGGTVSTLHGVLPVPAPATAELLVGIPTIPGDVDCELTTPTGAALLGSVEAFGRMPAATPRALGYGAGTRNIGRANVCRLIVADAVDTAVDAADIPQPDATVLLETNIDHIAPEQAAVAAETLLAEGALDVWVTPIVMKKSRAALQLSLLVHPDTAEHFATRTITLTGSLGVRVCEQPRLIAPREQQHIATPWGNVRVKVSQGRMRAEHDDIARIAREYGLDYPDVLAYISALMRSTREA